MIEMVGGQRKAFAGHGKGMETASLVGTRAHLNTNRGGETIRSNEKKTILIAVTGKRALMLPGVNCDSRYGTRKRANGHS